MKNLSLDGGCKIEVNFRTHIDSAGIQQSQYCNLIHAFSSSSIYCSH